MSSTYHTLPGDLIPGELARASDVNDRTAAVDAGFDYLPARRTDGNKGFDEPITIPEPAEPGQAATRNFVETGVTSQVVAAEAARDAAVVAKDASVVAKEASVVAQLLSEKWAEGTLPGGAGTKSSKEHALDALATVTNFSDVTLPAAVTTVTDEGNTQIAAVQGEANTQLNAIVGVANAKITEVNDTGADNVSDVNAAGTTQVDNVNTAGTTQVGNVTTEGNTQVNRVTDEGNTQVAALTGIADEVEADRVEVENNKATVAGYLVTGEGYKNSALTYRNESEQIRDDLQGASPGNSELTPTAGSNPLSDSNGHIHLGWLEHPMTTAQADAIAASNRKHFAGSGFVNLGRANGSTGFVKNVGFNVPGNTTYTNQILVGNDAANSQGSSAEHSAVVNVYGRLFRLAGNGLSYPAAAIIKFPEAPDTSALLSRVDAAFIEFFPVQITGTGGHGVVYPYGAIQWRGSQCQFDAIPGNMNLVNTHGIAPGYYAYGKWDTSPDVGYGLVWATANQYWKDRFLRWHENHLEFDEASGELFQWQYRIRSVALPSNSIGSSTSGVDPMRHAAMQLYGVSGDYNARQQGKDTSLSSEWSNGGSPRYLMAPYSIGAREKDWGLFSGTDFTKSDLSGDCFMLPLCNVQRNNKGAYHPEWNPNGAAWFVNQSDGTTQMSWAEVESGAANAPTITSTADCFVAGNKIGGAWADGAAAGEWPYDLVGNKTLLGEVRTLAHKPRDFEQQVELDIRKFMVEKFGAAEAPGRMEVVEVTSHDMNNQRVVFGGPLNQKMSNRDVGSVLIGLAGEIGVISPSVYAGNTCDLKKYNAGTGEFDTVFTDQEIADNFTLNTPFLMWKRDTSNLPSLPAKYSTYTHCDIIGDPANYPDWLTGKAEGDHAVQGVPNVVDVNTGLRQYPVDKSDGGGYKTFRLSRKKALSGNQLTIYALNAGVWSTVSQGGADGNYDSNGGTGISNLVNLFSTDWVGGGSFDDNTVFFVYYTTDANPLIDSTRADPFAWIRNSVQMAHNYIHGAAIEHLVGKIGTSTNNLSVVSTVTNKQLDTSGGLDRLYAGYKIELTNPFALVSTPNVNLPAVKFLPVYYADTRGRLRLQLHWQEMVYDPTDATYTELEELHITLSGTYTLTGTGTEALPYRGGVVDLNTMRIMSDEEKLG